MKIYMIVLIVIVTGFLTIQGLRAVIDMADTPMNSSAGAYTAKGHFISHSVEDILKRSPGNDGGYVLNNAPAYWAISRADVEVLVRSCKKRAALLHRPVANIGESVEFIVGDSQGYRQESLEVCLPQTDPTRPLCPNGETFQANTFSGGGGTWTDPKDGKIYSAPTWDGLGSCCFNGGCAGPYELRTTASDYPQWLKTQH